MSEWGGKLSEWVGTLRLQTGNPTIYDLLVKEDKLFNSAYHLFAFGLVYGILYNLKEEDKKRNAFIPIAQISDEHIKDLLNICYLILDDGSGTKKIFDNMMAYADGGVKKLNEIFKQNKSFTITNLIRDAEELWNERVKDLNNINQNSN